MSSLVRVRTPHVGAITNVVTPACAVRAKTGAFVAIHFLKCDKVFGEI